jgi:hypothetical protein
MGESTLFSSAQRAAELDPIPGRSLERVSLVKTSDFASPKSSGFAPPYREHDVAGFQIPMDDARAVRAVEGRRDLDRRLRSGHEFGIIMSRVGRSRG